MMNCANEMPKPFSEDSVVEHMGPLFGSYDAEGFLSHLRLSHPDWLPKYPAQRGRWVFRGHANSNWPLIPSAWRASGYGLNEYFEKRTGVLIEKVSKNLGNARGGSPSQIASISTTLIELDAIASFSAMADTLGFKLPTQCETSVLSSNELELLAFDLQDRNSKVANISGTIDAMGPLAQHHGIPTRFLDWTRNPLVAAYFASNKPSEKADVCVWAINEGFLRQHVSGTGRKLNCEFREPQKSSSPFLRAQAGLFTSLGPLLAAQDFFEENQRWPTIPDLLHTTGFASVAPKVLRKLVLPREHVSKLRWLLACENILPASLMPTLDNVAQNVLQRWSLPILDK